MLRLREETLRSPHSYSYNKKSLDKLEINGFSWTHQRTNVASLTATLKFGDRRIQRDTGTEIGLPVAGTIDK